MIIPFLVGILVLLGVAAAAVLIGRAFCREVRARRAQRPGVVSGPS
ncbi:hypothetical protein J7F01_15125 [Streptomyces sp. ISL-22]|nr:MULTISPECIES: hypothetical protein [unclassified Streptomyces]MBT2423779.1 hypothetical protein [Streptomyces sp. ISL-24]MBT2433499.1 hypothetical protein [Streptomyces sp. ISL-22]